MSTIERLKELHKSAMRDEDLMVIDAITEEAIQEVFVALPKLLAVVEAAEAVLDEADPRKYGDMTVKQSDLANKILILRGEQ